MGIALVTGAASGLGHGLVTRLVERGDEVIAVDVDPSVHELGVRSFTCVTSAVDVCRSHHRTAVAIMKRCGRR